MVVLANSRPVLSSRVRPLFSAATGSTSLGFWGHLEGTRWITVIELLLYRIVVGFGVRVRVLGMWILLCIRIGSGIHVVGAGSIASSASEVLREHTYTKVT